MTLVTRDVRKRMDRAIEVAEALAIEREIARLNAVIETLESQLHETDERVVLATIAVQFQPLYPLEEEAPIPRDSFRLPFPWIDDLGLENLLDVR